MEWGDKVCPMVPISLLFLVTHCHDASVNASFLSSEKMSKVSLELRWKLHHEVTCNGKHELNKSKKSLLLILKVSMVTVLQ